MAADSMQFDDILSIVGGFGWYQKRLYMIIVYPAIINAMQMMNFVFIFGIHEHRCKIPEDMMVFYNDTESLYLDTNVSQILPMKSENVTWSTECQIFTYYNATNATHIHRCTEWEYDKSVYTLSGTSEFNLVCEQKTMKSVASMASFLGTLAASFSMGILGDIIGRKFVMCVNLALIFISGLALAASPDIYVFAVLHFISGFSQMSYFCMAVITVLELVEPSKRTFAGLAIELVYCLGELILCATAYFIRNWRHLQIAISVPAFILMFYWKLVPESPRWLIAKGRKKEALLIIQKIAEVNKRDCPHDINITDTDDSNVNFKTAIRSLFRSRSLVREWIIMILSWFVVTLTYYGLIYNTGRLAGNVYLNFFLSVVVEAIAYSLCLLLSGRFGRKPIHCGGLVLAGIACLSTIFTEILADESLHWMTIVLSLIGKCGISMTFGNIYVYTPELFPTHVRSFALGTSNTLARVGSMVSPYIANIADFIPTKFGRALPLIIFGSVGIIVGLLSLTLPETLSKNLPESIEDAVMLQRNQMRYTKDEQIVSLNNYPNLCDKEM